MKECACYRVLCVACPGFLFLEAALVTLFYSRGEAQGRYIYLLRGVLRQGRHVRVLQLVTVAARSVERSCPPCTGATHRSCLILCDVGAPAVAGVPSSVGGVLVTVCLTSAESQGWVDVMALCTTWELMWLDVGHGAYCGRCASPRVLTTWRVEAQSV